MESNLYLLLVNLVLSITILFVILILRKRSNLHNNSLQPVATYDSYFDTIHNDVENCIDSASSSKKQSLIHETYLRLLRNDMIKDDIIHAISCVIMSEILFEFKSSKYDLFGERFTKNMEQLPDLPKIDA